MREHCKRFNSQSVFLTTNYNIKTYPEMEWYFVVEPKREFVVLPGFGFGFPHTPKDRSSAPSPAPKQPPKQRQVISVPVVAVAAAISAAPLAPWPPLKPDFAAGH